MIGKFGLVTALGAGAALAAPQPALAPRASSAVNSTTCGGNNYQYNELAGYGFLAGNATDKYGDTIGGIGSSIAFNRTSWTKAADGSYTGDLYTLPDRGWNTQGTNAVQSRIHLFCVKLTPQPGATVSNPASPNIQFTYKDTILLYAPDGTPVIGLDADAQGAIKLPGYPDLPAVTYSGDGFGNAGPGGHQVVLDAEGLALSKDGGFWISDEYGPYIYRFGSTGVMNKAIRPVEALIPLRNGSESFSSNNPPSYNQSATPNPADPTSGRVNNHGLEGLTASPDGCTLYSLLQGAAIQEGGAAAKTERYVRFLQYDICSSSTPALKAEYVVSLPLYVRASTGKTRTADQSEIQYLSPTQFLVLSRDSGAGRAADSTQSNYRHADIFDVSNATNIAGNSAYDATNASIASTDGVLKKGITAATFCTFLDYNVNSQLNRFGVHNGGTDNSTLLNEKWESLALVPVDGAKGADGQWFLFSLSDDDFITQNGLMKNGTIKYSDASGYNLDNQALAFKVTLPSGVSPA